jgi:hypothetical protein
MEETQTALPVLTSVLFHIMTLICTFITVYVLISSDCISFYMLEQITRKLWLYSYNRRRAFIFKNVLLLYIKKLEKDKKWYKRTNKWSYACLNVISQSVFSSELSCNAHG